MVTQSLRRVPLRLVKGVLVLQLIASLTGSPVFAQAAPPRNFNMVTLGDSIMWGQGLPESVKFRTLVANWLQSQYGSSRQVVQWQTHAHSGAVTGWGLYPAETKGNDPDTWYATHPSAGYGPGYPYPGEVPFGYPSISYQIGMTVNDLKAQGVDPTSIDLVLVDGCINDLTVAKILDFTTGDANSVSNWTNELCVAHMQSLLPQVVAQFPNAAIVVTGYFPIVSNATDLHELAEHLTVLGIMKPLTALAVVNVDAALSFLAGVPAMTGPVTAAIRSTLADRSQAFATTAFNGLSGLVNQVNQNPGGAPPRVALAWPNFSDNNAYAAPNSFLFSLNDFLSDETRGSKFQPPPGDWNTPQGVAYYRAEECARADPYEPTCYAALMGHPNQAGAQAYATAIIGTLQAVFSAKLFPPPVVSSVSPSGAPCPNSPPVTATIAGANFYVVRGVRLDGSQSLTFTPQSVSQLTATIPVSMGLHTITVDALGGSSVAAGPNFVVTPQLTASANTSGNPMTVTVTSCGAPVAGASVAELSAVGPPPSSTAYGATALTDANGVAVITRMYPGLCYPPGSIVPKVGQTTVPLRTPVPCPAVEGVVSKPGYQSTSIALK